MKYLGRALSAVMVGLITMPWVVMCFWPPDAGRGAFLAESLPVLMLGTIVMARDTTMEPRLPRGDLVFPLLIVGVVLPLVVSVLPLVVVLLLPVDTLLTATILLSLGIEVAATGVDRPELRWLRLGCCSFVCVSVVATHLFNCAASPWLIAPASLGGATTYAVLAAFLGPLPPERVMFAGLGNTLRTTAAYVTLGVVMAVGVWLGLAAWELSMGRPLLDLPP